MTRTSYRLPVLWFLLSFTAVSLASGQQTARDDKASIAALIEQNEAANNAGDVDRWVALFAIDFMYMAPGAPPVTTRQGLVEVARTGFRNRASIDIAPIEIRVLGDWAFATTTVTGSVKLHGSGQVVPIDVKQVVIYTKNELGQWRIARLISNSNTQ